MNDLFSLREAEIFETLKGLAACEFVVIGGYAVNAYALPRFSVDCDLVLQDEDGLRMVERALVKRGYVNATEPEEAAYAGSFSRWEKRLANDFTVSMDLLIGSVTDRTTGASFTAEWIFKHSSRRVLRGKTFTEELKVRIIDCNALIVMKIIAGRATDIRDVFMMIPNVKEKKWIGTEIAARYDAHDRIEKLLEKVASKQFKDGLAGVYGRIDQKTFDKHQKAITNLQTPPARHSHQQVVTAKRSGK